MTFFYSIVIGFCCVYIFFSKSTQMTVRYPNTAIFGWYTVSLELRQMVLKNLYKGTLIKIFLLCSGLSVAGSFLFFQDVLGILSLLTNNIDMIHVDSYWIEVRHIFPAGLPWFFPEKYPTILTYNSYVYFSKSVIKFYNVFFIGIFFVCSFFHCILGTISLLYDYFLKRLFLKNNHILVCILLTLVQCFLKIFFLLVLCL